MRITTVLATLCFAAFVSGCVANQNASTQGYLGRVDTTECWNGLGDARPEVRKAWADAMRVPLKAAPKLFCHRLNNALDAGKISESDYKDVFASGVVSARVLKVLRGDKGVRRLLQ